MSGADTTNSRSSIYKARYTCWQLASPYVLNDNESLSRRTRDTHMRNAQTYTHLCLPIWPDMSHYNYWQSIIIRCWRFEQRQSTEASRARIGRAFILISCSRRAISTEVSDIYTYIYICVELCTANGCTCLIAEYGSPGPDPIPPMGHLLHNWLFLSKKWFFQSSSHIIHICSYIYTHHIYIYIANISNIWE